MIRGLLDMVGNVDRYFLIVAMFVVVVGVLSVGVSLYNTMNERRREIAILRAIGARRATILRQLLVRERRGSRRRLARGLLLGRLLVLARARLDRAGRGVRSGPWTLTPFLSGAAIWWAEPLLVIAGRRLVSAVAGLLPALKGYRTDVASNLAPTS